MGETPRQAGLLFSAQMASTFCSFGATVILGRTLPDSEYGRFAFCLSVIVIIALLFDFGLFSAGARLLALAADRDSERTVLGALLMITAGFGLVLAAIIATIAVPVDRFFNQDVHTLLLLAATLAFFQPFQLLLEQCCQGLNRIQLLSTFQLLISGSNLVVLALFAAGHRLTAAAAVMASLAGTAIGSLVVVVRLKPRFSGASGYFRQVLKDLRGYGFNIYLARVTATSASLLDVPMISYFLGRANAGPALLGRYSYAQKLGNPIATMSRALAISRFRAFAKLTRVPGKIKVWNAALLIAAAAGLVFVGPLAVRLIFPNYEGAIPLLLPFAVLNVFAGLFQPYNAFLASHGRGREIRNIAIAVTVASLGGIAVGLPLFGVAGAAWAGAVAMALDYALHVYYYRKLQRDT
ncbi:MAG TPA: oligosaccharide flippase family protein [Blastocatellia bacterium]|nr:oligosaccharide flippase family protein [Blastocatellia bacterium]